MNRRRFLHGASAIAVGAMSCQPRRAAAQSGGEVIAMLNGGDYAKACIEAYAKPFEAETGIKVTPITEEFSPAKLELAVSTNNVSVDVLPMGPTAVMQNSQKGYLEKIDYSIYKPDDLDALLDLAKDPHGVGSIVYALCMTYNTEKFPTDKPRPTTWAEFWDVVKYPGVRALQTGEYPATGPWEEALLADGVPADALYPLDIDRAFASLGKIKPHIRKWMVTGSENQQMLHDRAVDLAQSYDGRAVALIDQGAKVEINRNQQRMSYESWTIPKGSPNPKNAQRFIEFMTRADRQAAFVQLMPYGPTNRNAFKLLPEKVGRKFASHPDYRASTIITNYNWYNEVGSDGLTNNDRLIQRWNEWILQ
ncbi:ABC transporter substrate-binding protein [Mesorhizobium humile]|uniref:ABC transporter substrate-binding protein n=1 Tax=Mesorhizobium humile TaxID=3072313 RepID=A0ABU4YL35_9HYPH|nr:MULTISPECIES: ABC transporter substrate-binding protein [unclassified Mesorhizobium]MDX8462482.1 ABC transporter substrate-binding protein [Mesorhizobium sp. VK2D]MDX8487678.1 ABC transporter substrate-binding protein [Mesorhizobium sp. VK2B]